MDEKLLAARMKKGDERAFEAFLSIYSGRVYSLCLRILKNARDAEDAAQDAFIKVYTNIAKFRGSSSLSTWVYSVARNTALDHLRKRAVCVSTDELAEFESSIFDDPQKNAEDAELSACISGLINSLSKDQREVVVLKDVDGYSYEEISEILNVSLGTVKSRLSRGREKLRTLLKGQGIL